MQDEKMGNVKIIDPLTDLTWNSTCKESPFYTSNWAEVISGTYGYKPLYFVLCENERIRSYIPVMVIDNILTGKRGISLPFSDICEPYAVSRTDFKELFDYIIDYGMKDRWRTFEIRGGKEFLSDHKMLSMYYEHLLDLSKTIDALLLGFKENVRRNIKKAVQSRVEISFYQTEDALKEFIRLNKVTRKRHGLPSQPVKFFYNLYEKIIMKKSGLIISAKHEGRTIASNIYLVSGDQVIYKYGSSDYRLQSLRANNLLMWESIKYFKDQGYRIFSFGRTFPDNAGPMRFKSGWSDNIRRINYYKYNFVYDEFETDNNPERSYINVFFRNLPIFVSSFIGTIFYKYFA